MNTNQTSLQLNQVKIFKVNQLSSKYGLQHRVLSHTEQQALKGKKISSLKNK